MLFEYNTENFEGYVLHDISVSEIPMSDFENKLRNECFISENQTLSDLSLVLFEEESSDGDKRFSLGVYVDELGEIVWVLKNFTIPRTTDSDLDYLSGILTHWLHS